VTIAKRPFVGRDGQPYTLICFFGKSEYFSQKGLDKQTISTEVICPSGKSGLRSCATVVMEFLSACLM
jgi:hypothetical protein